MLHPTLINLTEIFYCIHVPDPMWYNIEVQFLTTETMGTKLKFLNSNKNNNMSIQPVFTAEEIEFQETRSNCTHIFPVNTSIHMPSSHPLRRI